MTQDCNYKESCLQLTEKTSNNSGDISSTANQAYQNNEICRICKMPEQFCPKDPLNCKSYEVFSESLDELEKKIEEKKENRRLGI